MMMPAWLLAIGKFLRGIPLPVWLFLALTAAFWWYGEHRHAQGVAEVRAEWNAAIERGKADAANLKDKQGKVTERVVVKYVDRVKTVYQRGATITKEIPVYVPANSCSLPGGFRVLHDAAAANAVPDAASAPNAAAVPAQTATATIVDNYTTCHAIAEQLIALQQWVKGQQELNK